MDINSLLSPSESSATGPTSSDDPRDHTPSMRTPTSAPSNVGVSPFASPCASPQRPPRPMRQAVQKRKSSGLTRELYAHDTPKAHSPVPRGSLTPLGTPGQVPEEYTAQLRLQQQEALSHLSAEEREAVLAAVHADAQERELHGRNPPNPSYGLPLQMGSRTQPGSVVASPVLGMANNPHSNTATSLPLQQNRPPRSASVGAAVTGPPGIQRQDSSAGMDTLADLASMQQRQVASPSITNSIHYTLKHLVRTPSTGPMGSDPSAGAGALPRLPAAPFLTDAEETQLNELYTTVVAYPEDDKSRATFVDLLYRGLQNYRTTQNAQNQNNGAGRPKRKRGGRGFTPLTLVTVEQLGQWRPYHEALALKQIELVLAMRPDVDAMAALIGLAPSFEAIGGAIARKRVQLAALWWHQAAVGLDADSLEIDFGRDVESVAHWKENGLEERAKTTFTWDAFAQVAYDAVASAKYSPCHLGAIIDIVWKCAQLQLAIAQGDEGNPGGADRRLAVAKQCNDIFAFALREPHAQWPQTLENYSVFLALMDREEDTPNLLLQFPPADKVDAFLRRRLPYETEFANDIENLGQPPRSKEDQYAHWEEYLDLEIGLGQSWQTGELPDGAAADEVPAGQEEWEDRVEGLFSRFCARFGDLPEAWMRWIVWAKEREAAALARGTPRARTVRQLLDRAVLHCPGSGALWSLLLLHMEANGSPYQAIEELKHSATRHNLIEEIGGPEEVINFQVSWCGYLRRRALECGPDETDGDDILNAEIGIRGAIEHVGAIVAKSKGVPEHTYHKYADGTTPGITGDPHFRLERTYLKYLIQRSLVDDARVYWTKLQDTLADYFQFWDRYYVFEMALWEHWLGASRASHHPSTPEDRRFPRRATNVLRAGLRFVGTMDEPEKLLTAFENHIQQHESAREIIAATCAAVEARATIAKRRRAEMAAWQKGQDAWVAAQKEAWSAEHGAAAEGSNKRKLEAGGDAPSSKRAKTGEEATPEPAKRDREHSSVLMTRLPSGATELDVKKFFRGCGDIKSVYLAEVADGSKTAVVEFESAADAQFAQMRGTRPFQGESIDVALAGDLTLYVTNYPRDFGSDDLRKVFAPFGQVLSLRLPNLAKNAFRRFAYVTMDSAEAARAAIEHVHETALTDRDGKEYVVQVRLSDPDAKKGREGAMYEGREIVVKNLPFKAGEGDLRAFILSVLKDEVPEAEAAPAVNGDAMEEDARGEAKEEVKDDGAWMKVIERVRIPQGKSKGVGFVVFRDANLARASLTILEGRAFMDRPLHVELATAEGRKLKVTATERFGRGSSAGPSDNRNGAPAVSPGSEPAPDTDAAGPPTSRPFARSITISNLSPTTPEAVIASLASQHGPLVKISVRPEKGTAVVEYVREGAAGTARLAMDGAEVEGRTVRVALGVVAGGGGRMGSGFVSRPGQAGRGRRGGLGAKRGR